MYCTQVGSITTNLASTGLSVGNYVSDGAMYYPSINKAKKVYNDKRDELEDLKPKFKELAER